MYRNLIFLETWIQNLNLKNRMDNFFDSGFSLLLKLVFSILIFIIGKKLIHFLINLLEKYFNRIKIEISVSLFFIALIRSVLFIILIIIIITDVVGIKSISIAAIVGSAGLSIGLALQGSLSNFAGGVLILLMKPFRVGDYIIVGGNEGTVTAIDIFYTRLLTADNRLLVMPNGSLSNANLINVTHEPIRRLDISVLIDYSEDIKKVKELLTKTALVNELVLKEKEINIFVNSFDPSAINIGIRVWVLKENYLQLKWELLESIKNQFDENQITIPFDQLNVNIKNNPDTESGQTAMENSSKKIK